MTVKDKLVKFNNVCVTRLQATPIGWQVGGVCTFIIIDKPKAKSLKVKSKVGKGKFSFWLSL